LVLDLSLPTGDGPHPLLVFCHGFKDFGYFPLLDAWAARAGFALLRFNFTHNGTTPAHPTEFIDLEAFARNTFSQEQADLERLVKALQGGQIPHTENLDLSRLGLWGHSRGGTMALVFAAHHPQAVKAVATWGAVADLAARYTPEQLAAWELAGRITVPNARTGQHMPMDFAIVADLKANAQTLQLPRMAHQIQQPVFLVHGDYDATVNLTEALELHRWLPDSDLYVLHTGDHTLGGKHPWPDAQLPLKAEQATRQTLRFFRRILLGDAAANWR